VIRPLLLNSLWQLAGTRETNRFEAALARPEETQQRLLGELVRRNATTEFGREHGFPSVRTVEEYRSRVPIREYDDFLPWIRQIRQGRSGVLTTSPVTRLVPTGGSTGGRKLIPWTASLGREFHRALAPWIVDTFRSDPELKRGPAYWSVSPPPSGSGGDTPEAGTSGGPPIGFDGDSRYLGGPLGTLVRPILAVPEGLGRGLDARAFQAQVARRLLQCRELRLISVWHPSFLLLLLDSAGIRDTQAAWPHLGLISCWTDAGAASSVAELRRRFPGVAIQGKGLLSTEAFSSIPFGGKRPLAVRSHFFEFLDGAGESHLAHEIREGGEYELVVSTSGGLHRYRTHDRVQVTGRLGGTPTLRFLGRGDRTSDLRGEKLSDGFVQGVLDRLFGGNPAVRFALVAPAAEAPVAGYTLFLEHDSPGENAREWIAELDRLLAGNPQYRYARELGQLTAPGLFLVRGGGHRAYLEALAARGRRLGEIKPAALDPWPHWHSVFQGEQAPS